MFHRYHYFSTSVALFEIPDRLGDLAQRVAPVNYWDYFSGLKELLQDYQVILI